MASALVSERPCGQDSFWHRSCVDSSTVLTSFACCLNVTHTLLRKLSASHSSGDIGLSRSLVEQ
eukprot:7428381-Alexandrium_andersonii.AAC.1